MFGPDAETCIMSGCERDTQLTSGKYCAYHAATESDG